MKHIRKFNETKKDSQKKEKDQEVLFNAKNLVVDEKPSIVTQSDDDNEKVQKEFKKSMDKVEKFESFIDVHIDNIENVEVDYDFEHEHDDSDDNEFEAEYEEDGGCGCCDDCNGQPGCDCGCDDCKCGEEDVQVMQASDFISSLFSESLKYHLDNNKPITENIFRPGSEAFFEVIKEARQMFDLGKVELCDIDRELFESTEIGNFAYFNGELVALDLPMIGVFETNQPAFSIHDVNSDFQVDVMGKLVTNVKPLAWTKNGEESCITFEGEVDGQSCKCRYDDGQDAYIFEAQYHGKDVKLNYPMRGGTKKYYVYVKSKKGNVKKIAFGDVHGGLTAKVSDPKARKSFAARHQCDMKKDKTKAGYWACRINKYGHLFGGKTYPGYW